MILRDRSVFIFRFRQSKKTAAILDPEGGGPVSL